MLIPNNPEIDFAELNRRIAEEAARYRASPARAAPLPVFAPSSAPPPTLPDSWEALIVLEDEALVSGAYSYLLGRLATAEELQQGLAQLWGGLDKFEWLAALRYSAEGLAHGAAVHGLRRARLKVRLRAIPLLGRLLLSAYASLNAEARERHYRARFTLQQRQQAQLQAQVAQLQHLLEQQVQQLASLQALQAPQVVTPVSPPAVPAALAAIPESFYRAFEDRFRGDEATLRERLAYYLPLLAEVAPLQQGLPLVDIGCGRGEWLQMLPAGCARIGIDLNALNVAACHERGLAAEQADALYWLAAQAPGSVAVISAFHVIEHLSFAQLNTLLDECLRVLAPGGLLIFETPNPENLITAATHFYTDPTHRHPLPPALTEFLVQFKGFAEVTLHRLNPIPREYALDEDSEVARRCDALFYGPQDYAVTARR
ncbi:class I SAM-dependent methyltransferase [Pseudomonas sp. NW5]|uniref:class I SAM-dependent methyltransferase n=1 Tax=Pseudomonas sp. NW5 TaxID=2934934 RepID=UPI002021B9CA|nr:class I SAM-dependent methyltransferase [Pseudomonas sp. NW5]MCL7461868.1 class I SAM-dependent methyltransferase [Pseudomonas sp. NW5]